MPLWDPSDFKMVFWIQVLVKSHSKPILFFQKMYSKSHFKKFFRSKWLIELLQMPSVAPDTDFGQKVPKQALLF